MSFSTLLVANRGEIARRVIRSAHAMGIRCIAIYVDADTDAATWYMAGDPNQIDTVEVCFLEDEQTPQLKQETEFDTGDAKFAITHVVAAKAIEYRGVYKNAGN